jgi:hypothetical protein|tara:strand:+ start:141 stop:377 length:237 start_codon:yes stop_codon:yes gene_type:complete
MKETYIYSNGEIVKKPKIEKERNYSVISDVQPFTSPIDGTVLSSRSQIRDHERKHQVRQCGNDYTSSEKPSWWDNRHG